MKPAWTAFFGIASLAAASSGCALSPLSTTVDRRVVLISIDGFRPEFYKSADYEAPNLKHLAATGISADAMMTVFPSLTYPSHATLVTGVVPARHGIVANREYSAEKGVGDWFFQASSIKAPTLWDRARAAGKTVAIIHWPGTLGANVDWFVPEVFGPNFDFAEDWALVTKNMKKELLDEILAAYPHPGFKGFSDVDEFTTQAAIRILPTYRPQLALIHFINLDLTQHATGRASPETKAALKTLDEKLGRLLATLDLAKTTVFIVGDHGFMDYDKTINVKRSSKFFTHSEGGQAAIYSRDKKSDLRTYNALRKNARDRYTVLSTANTRPAADAARAARTPEPRRPSRCPESRSLRAA
ncbi:MAG: alkaline phosphatase family protein [Deltaproteobacteria bacterium]|nr:alkaline phosphatase family protein [Deltaproteobacteria bacterium]